MPIREIEHPFKEIRQANESP